VILRPATAADTDFVRELSTEAFAAFGDYRDLLPRWTAAPGVSCWLAVEGDRRIGFAMVGFYFADAARTWVYADLLAIAVVEEARGRGVGRALVRKAIDVARAGRAHFDVRELRLTVAEPNERARRLFASEGFVVSDEDHGHYDHGQRALRMSRPVP